MIQVDELYTICKRTYSFEAAERLRNSLPPGTRELDYTSAQEVLDTALLNGQKPIVPGFHRQSSRCLTRKIRFPYRFPRG